MKSSKATYKYSKITPQKKFHLLSLVLKEKRLIKDAAKIVGINYSTAKTIIFFNRNGDKSYQFQLQKHQNVQPFPKIAEATFKHLTINSGAGHFNPTINSSENCIQVISTIGSRQLLEKSDVHSKAFKGSSSIKSSSFSKFNSADLKNTPEDNYPHKRDQNNMDITRPMTRSQVSQAVNKIACKMKIQEQPYITIKKYEQ